jgi:hypothetical protein
MESNFTSHFLGKLSGFKLVYFISLISNKVGALKHWDATALSAACSEEK